MNVFGRRAARAGIVKASFPHIKALVELVKPRALVMIIFTTGLSYLIAATDTVVWTRFVHTLIGVGLAGGGSLALNQYMERRLDARMARTQGRPLPSGRLQPAQALFFGWASMLSGYIYLWFWVNPLCSAATLACGVSYLLMYTPLKLRSSFSSFVGAIPGGLLPLMGWAAARGRLEIGAWVLFVILFLWQIPHALIISIRHREDYRNVGMKQLPIVAYRHTSSRQMIVNLLVLIPVTILPPLLNMTKAVYPFVALGMGLALLGLALHYVRNDSERSANRVFLSLTAYLPLLLLAMYLDKPA